MWSLGKGRAIFALVSRYVLSTSVDRLLVQSLYILNMEQNPKSPLRCNAVMSLFGMFSGVYESVDMLVLTSMMDLMVEWLAA